DDVDSVDLHLQHNHVDYVMYSVTTVEHPWFFEKNKELKKKYRFTAVVGGPHFTFFPEQGLSDPDIDLVVQGPGEGVILDVIEGRAQEKFVKGHLPDDINAIATPDRSILYKYEEISASQDCSTQEQYSGMNSLHQP
ncbi:unnamed protein product, partial [marine sediment metagenome]